MKTSPNYRDPFSREVNPKLFRFLEKGCRYRFTFFNGMTVVGNFSMQTPSFIELTKGLLTCLGHTVEIEEEFGYHFNKSGVTKVEFIALK